MRLINLKKLRTRLIFSHLLPVLVIVPVLGAAILYILETQVVLANYANEIIRQTVLVAEIAGGYTEIWFDPERAQVFVTQISPRVTGKVMLLDPTGRLLVSSDPSDTSLIGQVLNQENIENILNGEDEIEVNYDQSEITDVLVPVITSTNRLLGFVRIENPLSSTYEHASQLRQVTIWILIGGLSLGVILALILAGDLERPLRNLTQAVSRLSQGARFEPIQEQGPEELRLLVRSVNQLEEKLHSLEASRRRLLANLVHEIGTPLGALRSANQALLRGADEDPDLRKELLKGTDSEIDRLHNLLNELAHLHDQVLGTLELNLQPIRFQSFLPQLLLPWEKAAQEKGIHFDKDLAVDLPEVNIDLERITQVINNLLSNAIRYSQPGGQVKILTGMDSSKIWLSVADNGPGIAEDEKKQVFTPFYRGKAAGRFSEGMGLGLSIAQDIIHAHGGEIQVESQPGRGSTFSIVLNLSLSKTTP